MEKKYLNEKEVSALTGLSVAFFQQSRFYRKGPNYLKIGSRILYSLEDIEKWLNSSRVFLDERTLR